MAEEAPDRELQARETIERLRTLLRRGATLKEASAAIGASVARTHRLAVRHRLPRRRRAMPAAKRRLIDRELAKDRLTLGALARLAKVSTATVWKHKLARQRAIAGPGPRPARAYRCPRGHLVKLKPCQICRALDAAEASKAARELNATRKLHST
jgi:hypothetical protein